MTFHENLSRPGIIDARARDRAAARRLRNTDLSYNDNPNNQKAPDVRTFDLRE